eukprot:SAG22_NODE_910_length_6547_cov_2.044975_7_plen_84_part_00
MAKSTAGPATHQWLSAAGPSQAGQRQSQAAPASPLILIGASLSVSVCSCVGTSSSCEQRTARRGLGSAEKQYAPYDKTRQDSE